MILCFLLFLLTPTLGFVQRISNRIRDSRPSIYCNSGSISVAVSTVEPFVGRIFVKGHSKDDNCALRGNGTSYDFSLSLLFHKCGLLRNRTPDGITVTTTVIISFHPYFLTESDGAFRLQCIYRNQNQLISRALEGRGSRPVDRIEKHVMPTCRYDILENGPHGHPIPFASVGTTVYHKWSCISDNSEEHCMIVHSCVAENDSGETVEILDQHGCAVDPVLLDNLQYSKDLVAGQSAQVYKFADKESIYFQCQIMIFKKTNDHKCARPQCRSVASSGDFRATNNTQNLGVAFDRKFARLRSRSVNYDVNNELTVTMGNMVKEKQEMVDKYDIDCASMQNIVVLFIVISVVSCVFSFVSFYLFCWKF
ncbi:unnamed protein product [Bursaphelenchus okinawaensis]|uniref:ZP domain-containing protein n=1 Tax=Bursaphelenchus okinawaensis TaxID=465554 RepID=A0A811K6R4_9BILA|nr:unnamed protein product [Bursaphelenchus okinawaensis]CAG9092604.1 unnamed protein product [Bursaphelenchus okinawaensis]